MQKGSGISFFHFENRAIGCPCANALHFFLLFLYLKSMRQLALLIAAGLFPFPLYASSFAYEDIASYPRYRVVLTENRIAESDILDNFDKVKKKKHGCIKERVYTHFGQQTTAWKQ